MLRTATRSVNKLWWNTEVKESAFSEAAAGASLQQVPPAMCLTGQAAPCLEKKKTHRHSPIANTDPRPIQMSPS